MSTLRLVNPQPMETLPKKGNVFIEYGNGRTVREPADEIHRYSEEINKQPGFELVAWSYTATFEPETLNKETNDENETE